jgi:hypothetical protein
MRKTDHTSNFGHGTFEDRTLDDKELDAVAGGWPFWPSPPQRILMRVYVSGITEAPATSRTVDRGTSSHSDYPPRSSQHWG